MANSSNLSKSSQPSIEQDDDELTSKNPSLSEGLEVYYRAFSGYGSIALDCSLYFSAVEQINTVKTLPPNKVTGTSEKEDVGIEGQKDVDEAMGSPKKSAFKY
ncbi:hypothetical protein CFOL_v3_09955 [Cephalotus follicularis]|uniref:Uncharacterized protein n=1 Tax=Cephalotus follicularis TaxID=3775 RepID=A0A1Q3BEU9_CEPFO|nr:hypothetical protein CFOL_v3_09955 [Cephalotus follicularis]